MRPDLIPPIAKVMMVLRDLVDAVFDQQVQAGVELSQYETIAIDAAKRILAQYDAAMEG